MRWFWIDRFLEFQSGQRAVAIKHVSLAEDYLTGGMYGYPILPASLIVEGMAQTGGLLVGEHNRFAERVVLAKIGRATFHDLTTCGQTLCYTAVLEDIQSGGAIVHGTVFSGERLQAELELVFAHLDDRFPEELFEPAEFLRLLRILGLYEIGRHPDGSPLEIPARLLRAELIASGRSVQLADQG